MRTALFAFIAALVSASIAGAGGGVKQRAEAVTPPAPRAPMPFRRPICIAAGAVFGEIDDASTGAHVFHSGLDFPAAFGTPVHAAAAGRVTAAERRGPYGLFIEIDHGAGFATRYGQLQNAYVRANDSVAEGQNIATVGSSGRSVAPHLHFEVTQGRFAYDPLLYLSDDPTCAAKLPREANADHRVRVAGSQTRPTPSLAMDTMPFSWPLCGPSPKGFGYRVDPYTQRVAFHSGIDLDAPAGTPIRASAHGRVITAEVRGPYGKMVEIDHGPGLRTRYGHLAAFRVSPGDVVGRGEIIGDVGSTGRAKRPHLHFEIWYRDVVRDPRQYLEAEPACMVR